MTDKKPTYIVAEHFIRTPALNPERLEKSFMRTPTVQPAASTAPAQSSTATPASPAAEKKP